MHAGRGPHLGRSTRAAAVALAALLAPGCSFRAAPASLAPRPPPPQAPPQAPPPPDAMQPAAAVPEPPEVDGPDPDARRVLRQALASPPAALAATPSPPRVTAMALHNTARGEANGMTPQGDPFVATLTEGQCATVPVELDPSACMTFIAHGGLGVVEVDLFLTTGEAPDVQVLAEDASRGPTAIIGGRRGCFRAPDASPVGAGLRVTARRGSGVVVVQAFRR